MIADMASTRRLPFRLNGVWPQTSGLPTMVRAPILPPCSSSPRQKPTRSAPPSTREVNCRLLSSCAGCSPASPTTRRRGSAHASLPDGCRCRLDRPGCLGAGAGSHSGAVPHCAFGAATAGFRVTTRAGLERITPPARSGRGGARAGRRRECQSAARPTPFSRRNHRAASAPVDPRADSRGRRWSCASRRRTAPAAARAFDAEEPRAERAQRHVHSRVAAGQRIVAIARIPRPPRQSSGSATLRNGKVAPPSIHQNCRLPASLPRR